MMKNAYVRVAPGLRVALVSALAAAVLASCQATPAEKAAAAEKRAAPKAVIMGPTKGQVSTESSLTHYKDGYPSFGAPLTAANVQMNDDQAAGQQKTLTALAAQRKSGAISEAEYQRRVAAFRKLAADHGTDTLSQMPK
ncbi:hypothetical protein [Oryzifoliimicrobium ureilyticus]|uniref:hypothetical protein n=1 Tax=Oryzifoliimicrobium ureilyticus TaxID=3113724 RepID=UPI0030762D6F